MKWQRQKLGPSLPPWVDDETTRAIFLLVWTFLGIPAIFLAIGWMLICMMM